MRRESIFPAALHPIRFGGRAAADGKSKGRPCLAARNPLPGHCLSAERSGYHCPAIHLQGCDFLNDFPKALNEWQSKLYDLGYPGPYEAGSMMIAATRKRRIDNFSLVRYSPRDWHAEVTFKPDQRPATVDHPYGSLEGKGKTPEEAVANLMIAHPELWRVA
jgi:hypothetical protein